ncbi:MAG: hypothetical protein WCR42_00300 [bacterium]
MKYDSKTNKFLLCFLALLVLGACSPDRFTLDKISGQNRIEGFEIRSIHDADVRHDNAFILNENGAVSLRAVGETEGTWDFGLNFLFGQDVNIAFRDVSYEYISPRAVYLNLSDNLVRIIDSGKEVFTNKGKYNFSYNTRFQFINDGFNYTLIIDCDTIYKGKTTIPSTEYIIFESLNNSKVFLSGIDFRKK